ncbi:MAG: ATP synthase subunit I [Lachnospiraceae bacterium]|nr:ATP synthase subunit I [Lachnospiraceae bacterium]
MKLQKAVKDETVFVALGSIILSVIMVIVFFILHRVFPERVPMDLPVIIGAVGGCAVAIGNFFLMAVTVQKVAGIENYDQAYRSMQVSYRYRTFLQLIWCVLTMVLGFINPVAGMLPLLWPSLLIKGRGILNGVKN